MRLAEVGTPVRKQVLKAYLENRELGRRLLADIVQYIPGGMLKAGKKLGLTVGKTFVFESESEMTILTDYAVFNERSGAVNAIDRYVKMHKNVADQYPDFFNSIKNSFFSVFVVISKVPGFGLGLRDLQTGDEVHLIDVHLSESWNSPTHLVGRVIPFSSSYYCTSGAFIPITHQWAKIAIFKALDKFLEHAHSDKQPVFSPKQSAAFQAEVLRILLRAEESEGVAFV